MMPAHAGIAAIFLAIAVLGLATGCRSMTAIAALTWFANLGRLPVAGAWSFWLASPITVAVFTLFAAGEWVVDKLPRCPNRTDPGPLLVRLLIGGLIGATVATAANFYWLGGALTGSLGAWAGTLLGFHLRRYLAVSRGYRDLWVALTEDLLVTAASLAALLLATR